MSQVRRFGKTEWLFRIRSFLIFLFNRYLAFCQNYRPCGDCNSDALYVSHEQNSAQEYITMSEIEDRLLAIGEILPEPKKAVRKHPVRVRSKKLNLWRVGR